MQERTERAETHLGELVAVEPFYHEEYGDCCRLHLGDGGTVLDRRSIRGVKQALTRRKALNTKYLRELCGGELERRLSLPLPLAADLILVPLKMRLPLTANDSAYGLVNLAKVRKVVGNTKGGALLVLCSGQTLHTVSTRETVLAHLAEGILVYFFFRSEVWGC
ncbi:MAG TPA: hypothetical protein VHQ46_06330 [Desulfobacteria bacterium]|nr:hypothetical protein [Desulfobacteria bacterium]